LTNCLPKPVEPRKFTRNEAYPRLASHWLTGLKPQPSRIHGPPCTTSTIGNGFDPLSGNVK